MIIIEFTCIGCGRVERLELQEPGAGRRTKPEGWATIQTMQEPKSGPQSLADMLSGPDPLPFEPEPDPRAINEEICGDCVLSIKHGALRAGRPATAHRSS